MISLGGKLRLINIGFFVTCSLFSVPNAATGIQMQNAADSQPITITNGQGQQITVIPTPSLQQQIRPAANIIQMPNNMSGFVQNIPGLGNVQVNLSYSRKLNLINISHSNYNEISLFEFILYITIGHSG